MRLRLRGLRKVEKRRLRMSRVNCCRQMEYIHERDLATDEDSNGKWEMWMHTEDISVKVRYCPFCGEEIIYEQD